MQIRAGAAQGTLGLTTATTAEWEMVSGLDTVKHREVQLGRLQQRRRGVDDDGGGLGWVPAASIDVSGDVGDGVVAVEFGCRREKKGCRKEVGFGCSRDGA
ncbi:hypothetical protein M0R45_035681 [Rubus argutus]|uniref:Uncharacterized protein n=1 Tax=Rubus argutus TaxID=59490 RepID=A0AAW1VUZ1_RUBAR